MGDDLLNGNANMAFLSQYPQVRANDLKS